MAQSLETKITTPEDFKTFDSAAGLRSEFTSALFGEASSKDFGRTTTCKPKEVDTIEFTDPFKMATKILDNEPTYTVAKVSLQDLGNAFNQLGHKAQDGVKELQKIKLPITKVGEQEVYDRKAVDNIFSSNSIFGTFSKLDAIEKALNDTGLAGTNRASADRIKAENMQWFNAKYTNRQMTDHHLNLQFQGYPFSSLDRNGRIEIKLYRSPFGQGGLAGANDQF